MKKLIALLLGFCLLLCGCGTDRSTDYNDEPQPAETSEPVPSEEPEERVAPSHKQEAKNADFSPDFEFSTVSLDGESFDESIFKEYKLIMINFWEPWCGPCVNEMPELQELYEDYKDEGFLILGVFSTEDGVQDVIDELGISYPILYYCSAFEDFQTGYVPTTIFVDGSGHIVGETQIGSMSYSEWADIVEGLL